MAKQTEEEKKIKALAATRAWRERNRERVKAQNKEYRETNREAVIRRQKLFQEQNKEEVLEYRKTYYKANREKLRAQQRERYEAAKLPYTIVYVLPHVQDDERAYCGVTNQPEYRMNTHKANGNNTKGWFILGVFKDRGEALIAESEYHEQGYIGNGGWRDN